MVWSLRGGPKSILGFKQNRESERCGPQKSVSYEKGQNLRQYQQKLGI